MRPVYLDQLPPPGFIGVMLYSPVFFRVFCAEGLNLSTLEVRINGVYAIERGQYQSGFYGVITKENHLPTAISVVVTPDNNFNFNEVVNVAAKITNNIDETGFERYDFLTITNPDVDGPIVVANPHGRLYNLAQHVTLTAKLLTD